MATWRAVVLLAWVALLVAAGPAPAAYVRPPPQKLELPTTPGDHKLKFTTRSSGKAVTMSYLLHLPAGYATATQRPPVLVFLHGIGECGTDLAGVYALGPMTVFKDADSRNAMMAASSPFVVLCPQCPPRGEKWSDEPIYRAVDELVDAVVHAGRVDADRVYVTGLSMGGLGTWCVAEAAPELFAAVVPMSAMEWQPERAAARLRFVAAWALTGERDESRFVDGNRAMEHALVGVAAVADRFSYLDDDHRVFDWAYAEPQTYEWMLGRRRPDAAARKAGRGAASTRPVVAAPGHYLLSYDGTLAGRPVQVDYGLYVPRPSAGGGAAKRPAVLFLAEGDTIGPVFHDQCCHGPDLALERHAALRDKWSAVVISPRLPLHCRWDSPGMDEFLAGLLEQASAVAKVDPDRVVVSGLDDGATAAWHLATAMPSRFAGVQWTSTKPDQSPPSGWEQQLATLPGGRVFTPNAGLRKAVGDLARKSRRDWVALGVAAGAGPLSDLLAYQDSATVAWLGRQRRPHQP